MRNGYHQPRKVTTAAGAVEVKAPRVNGKRVDKTTGEGLKMTTCRPCPPCAGSLEKCAARFDALFVSLALAAGVREYPTGLLAPRDRHKTITCLAAVEPVVGPGTARTAG
ncbi:hypothetical protein ACFV2N_45815 [Streptomyces sp. NPDC059680]|uniref:hypothetical protein n=1 Tax=Streptomyces sp. NPDC059680 TaxID=3346904 RepID=UPI0036C6D62D